MKHTDTILDKIVAAKRRDLRRRQADRPLSQIERELAAREASSGKSFFDAVKAAQPRLKLIAEVKQASPSAGLLRRDFSLDTINEAYQAADGVVAVSVLTEEPHFHGSDDVLRFFADHNSRAKPLLRKDFIFDPYQIAETKLLGAQAFLLIAALFERSQLQELVAAGLELGIEPLVEIHDSRELELAAATEAKVIGANSRDLRDFSIDLEVHELLRQLPPSYARIAESGIIDHQYLSYLADFTDAGLVGGSLMTAANIPAAIDKLVGRTAGSVKDRIQA